ncbi:dehydrogenase [Mammaliicoccus sciuri]|uniref:Gfo/Idh/MocA family oxidoreductase n=1 Tax=Mammaliicoccus sciuri TaxID=1296 RepID=UPI000734C93F|nr:Gfo/Idh/MocA family oxidoreductase [Mammaliicoccus sciuri]KTT86804.1 dehydrogenase [Mammaliicoccus sciuri]KTT87642.1 dehydrogenase [Mammaliicoccus sciuri]KTT89730.1 dehydrogenase [Mammaliicoccus sciuri]KTT92699.1 dehydrogenase [Mammaliicoccus sciuri]KTW10808.1 dehydrogenase [Mammaliicoccus sciuri]
MTKINYGLIGAGRMGSFHGATIAKKLNNANLIAIADPFKENADKLAEKLGVNTTYADPEELLNNPEIEAVVIATPAKTHAQLVIKSAQAKKNIFCEKPMAITLEECDEAINAVESNNVKLQIGFNRRFVSSFKAGHDEIEKNNIGTPQLLRSITRDPKLANAEKIPEWTIFKETLIHDFDTLNYMNSKAEPYEVFATADALIRPDLKEKGFLDTSVVTIKYTNNAIATAEANFQAVYGYDVRGEVFGSEGMITMGDVSLTNMKRFTKDGINIETSRQDTDLLHDAYIEELFDFSECIINDSKTRSNGQDAKKALSIALACIESVKQNKPINISNLS